MRRVSEEVPDRSPDGIESLWSQTLALFNRFQEDYDGGKDASCVERNGNKRRKPTPNCSNRKCSTTFGLFVSPQYCRRCGGSFCKPCLSCERRLNIRGELDPSGSLQKVCAECFEEEEPTIGQCRSHFQIFQQFRHNNTRTTTILPNNQKNSVKISNFRDSLNLDEECRRLRTGFKESLKVSLFGIVLPEVQVPAWKKSTFWVYGNMSLKCYSCNQEFGLRRNRHNCVVCGSVVCTECSTKDLLVYIPDGQDAQGVESEAELAIIRIIGCPEKEPEVCAYLRVCQTCNQRLQDQQVAEFQKTQKLLKSVQETDDEDVLLQMSNINNRLTSLKAMIDDSLLKYNNLLEVLDAGPKGSLKTPGHNKSNMQVLAKAQSDLSDHITSLATTAFGLKNLKPPTQRQMKIFKNILMSAFESYHDYRERFNAIQNMLETVTSTEILLEIQAVVNRNAINSCYLSLKQLALEVLHLCDKYKLTTGLLPKLVAAEEIVLEDLKFTLKDKWPEQEKLIDQFLSLQLQQHRLIKPSRRLLGRYGATHVQAVVYERTATLATQMLFQLQAKSSASSFLRTKDTLKELQNSCSELNVD